MPAAFEQVRVDQLIPHPDNPRRGNVEAVVASIRANGFYGALVVQRSTRHVLAGNHRLLAARQLGMDTVPVAWVDCDDDRARRILVADNRSSDLAVWDDRALADLLAEIGDGSNLDGTLFDNADLATLLDELADADDRTSDDYYTPAWVFELMGITFDLDVCAPPGGLPWIPATRSFSIDDDALTRSWEGRVWMNPPYSKPTPWVDRFVEHGHGIALVPHVNSAWHSHLWRSADAVAEPANSFDFVGGGVVWAVWFAAFGDDCIDAIARLGPCRVLDHSRQAPPEAVPRHVDGHDRSTHEVLREAKEVGRQRPTIAGSKRGRS